MYLGLPAFDFKINQRIDDMTLRICNKYARLMSRSRIIGKTPKKMPPAPFGRICVCVRWGEGKIHFCRRKTIKAYHILRKFDKQNYIELNKMFFFQK